jgi:predicted GNAT family acetyltransferase
MTTVLAHEPDASRYALYVDDALAALVDYRVQGDRVAFHHTYTEPRLRGQGLAARVVEFAVNDVEATGTKAISADCSYVADWFQKHPERGDMLQVR